VKGRKSRPAAAAGRIPRDKGDPFR
jgi:hypothetical protein